MNVCDRQLKTVTCRYKKAVDNALPFVDYQLVKAMKVRT